MLAQVLDFVILPVRADPTTLRPGRPQYPASGLTPIPCVPVEFITLRRSGREESRPYYLTPNAYRAPNAWRLT